MTPLDQMSDDQFLRSALDIISRELGLAGYARFLMTFCSGKGDYTAERHQWLSSVTIEDIAQDLNVDLGK
jgi:hypothetical protein